MGEQDLELIRIIIAKRTIAKTELGNNDHNVNRLIRHSDLYALRKTGGFGLKEVFRRDISCLNAYVLIWLRNSITFAFHELDFYKAQFEIEDSQRV